MDRVVLNLVVLRCNHLDRAVKFYSCLGLEFRLHRHGQGVEHYAAELNGGVFELYPITAGGPSSVGARIGFGVANIDSVVAALADSPGAVLSPPADSEWGRRAVVADPDGHKVELLQK